MKRSLRKPSLLRPCLLLLAAAACALGASARARAANSAPIDPPFSGLSWGLPREALTPMLQKVNARVEEKRIIARREVWTVSGLAGSHLHRTLFYFQAGGLQEVELQYQNTGWLESDYTDFMGKLRTLQESHYGEGRLIARSKAPHEGVVQTLTGYEWSQPGGTLQLVYFSAETTSQTFRMVSLHYKALL